MPRFAAFAAGLFLCCSAQAQSDYPNRPIRLVTPFNPGGAIDIYSRTIAEPLGRRARPEHRRRGDRGRQHHQRHPAAGARGARRLHLHDHDHVDDGEQPDPVHQAALRSGQGPRADHAALLRHGAVRRSGQRAVQRPEGLHRLGALEGSRHLRLLGHRLLGPSRRTDPQARPGPEPRARALQGRRARDHGRAERRARHHVLQPDQRQAAHRQRRDQADRDDRPAALGLDAGACDLHRAGRAERRPRDLGRRLRAGGHAAPAHRPPAARAEGRDQPCPRCARK